MNGHDFGQLVIAPRADHEAAEIWESIETVTVVGGALAVATLLLMSLLVAHLLKPIRMVGDALMVLDSGRYDVVVPETGPPEISDICRKLNRFAATLGRHHLGKQAARRAHHLRAGRRTQRSRARAPR